MSGDDLLFQDFDERLEIIVFDVGGHTYAADAALVTRIDRPSDSTIIRDDLGAPTRASRAIYFAGPNGAGGSLCVDAVRGMRTVTVDSLRRLPSAALTKNSCAMGVWLDGEKPVLLIDLFATLK